MAGTPPKNALAASVPVLHPPLLAVYRVLLLYANNMHKAPLSAVVRPALVLALAAIALWLGLWVVLRNRYKAGIIASILLVAGLTGWHVLEYVINAYVPFLTEFPAEGFYFAYGVAIAVGLLYIARRYWNRPQRAARAMAGVLVLAVGVVLAVVFVLAPAYGAGPAWAIVAYGALVAGLVAYVLQWKGQFVTLTQTANWFAVILVAISVALIVVQRPEQQVPAAEALEASQLSALRVPADATRPKPDIYLIVLEGYARADVLRNDYGYNNMPFFNAMREKGFSVAEDSFANYTSTVASLTSCLNMDPVQELLPAADATAEAADLLNLLHHNRVYTFLRKQGYRIVVFSPGAELLEPRSNVDAVLKPAGALSEFEAVLLDTSLVARGLELRDYWTYGSTFHTRDRGLRDRALFVMDGLKNVAAEKAEAPRFVYAHLLIPEPPFLFARDGSLPRSVFSQVRTPGGPRYRTTLSEYRQAYIDQLHYTNQMLLQAVDGIQRASATPPVILVVSSRGPVLQQYGEVSEAQAREQLANLILTLVPGVAPDQPLLPADRASLCNLFRATFAQLFGADLPLKAPAAYLCSNDWPMKFRAVPVEALAGKQAPEAALRAQ